FLSEGCITVERGRPRLRLTFHRAEEEYIRDVRAILDGYGVRTTLYQDKTFQTTTIRVGSLVMAYLFRDILKTGAGSRSMRIPDVLLGTDTRHRQELLVGLLRGDGDVDTHTGLRTYRKNGRTYTHEFNSGTAGFFSSSATLLDQTECLMLELGFHPTRKRGKPHLRLTGHEQLDRLAPLLGGTKGARLEQVRSFRQRVVRRR